MDKLNIFKWSKPEKKRISPIHLAHYQKQSISANLIFRYMAKIERKNLETLFDYMPELLVYEDFMGYFLQVQF